jgi:hypothetical protein
MAKKLRAKPMNLGFKSGRFKGFQEFMERNPF